MVVAMVLTMVATPHVSHTRLRAVVVSTRDNLDSPAITMDTNSTVSMSTMKEDCSTVGCTVELIFINKDMVK